MFWTISTVCFSSQGEDLNHLDGAREQLKDRIQAMNEPENTAEVFKVIILKVLMKPKEWLFIVGLCLL